MNVKDVVYELTTIISRDKAEHKLFLDNKKNFETLRQCEDLQVLFSDFKELSHARKTARVYGPDRKTWSLIKRYTLHHTRTRT